MDSKDYILPEDIRLLLEKYYNGETSLEEEKVLKGYFNDHQISIKSDPDEVLFSFQNTQEFMIFPEKELWKKIKEHETKQKIKRKIIRTISSVAASLIVIVSISMWYYTKSRGQNERVTDTFSNPQEAYRAAQKYLGLVSHKLSYAYNEIKPIENLTIPSDAMKPFSEIDKSLEHLYQLKTLNKSTKNLEHLAVFDDIVNINKKL